MEKQVFNYEYEVQSLLRDKQMTKNIVDSYKANILDRLPTNKEDFTKEISIEQEKPKSLWSKFLSML